MLIPPSRHVATSFQDIVESLASEAVLSLEAKVLRLHILGHAVSLLASSSVQN